MRGSTVDGGGTLTSGKGHCTRQWHAPEQPGVVLLSSTYSQGVKGAHPAPVLTVVACMDAHLRVLEKAGTETPTSMTWLRPLLQLRRSAVCAAPGPLPLHVTLPHAGRRQHCATHSTPCC